MYLPTPADKASPCGVAGLNCILVISEFELYSRLLHLFSDKYRWKKFGPPTLSPHIWVKLYHCCSSIRIGLVLNNSRRLICHYTKKRNQIIYIYIYIYHHDVVTPARISLTLSRHSSLSFIASGRSSGLHPVSSQSYCMYVRAVRPAFARPCVGVHRRTSLMSSSLLLQQYPACLVRLTWIVFVMGGRWPYSCCFVGCFRQDLFKISRSILV